MTLAKFDMDSFFVGVSKQERAAACARTITICSQLGQLMFQGFCCAIAVALDVIMGSVSMTPLWILAVNGYRVSGISRHHFPRLDEIVNDPGPERIEDTGRD